MFYLIWLTSSFEWFYLDNVCIAFSRQIREFDCFKEFTSTNSYDVLSWFTKTSSESYNSLSFEQIHSRISELSLIFNFNYFIVMIQEWLVNLVDDKYGIFLLLVA